MSNDSACCSGSLIPTEPLPPGAHAFTERMQTLMDGSPKDDATVAQVLVGQEEMLDAIAARMYTLASMLVGEGEESIRLVEAAVADTDISVCHDPIESRRSNRLSLAKAAIHLLEERTPGCLDAPKGALPQHTCIDDDELDAAGVSSEELETMIAGPDRERVRTWLESLPVVQRVVFVLRAVASIPAQGTAALLAVNGGPGAANWTADSVREVFRLALCSLASQLIHATSAR